MIQAAIDLGTVTSRLMIGEVSDGTIHILKRSIVITNLGEGLANTGIISNAAYTRLLGALLGFREDIAGARAELLMERGAAGEIPVKAVATSAMRDAQNSEEILEDLADVGFDIEIISGKREAELSFKGTLSGFSGLKEPLLTIDVGGGSTELILGSCAHDIVASRSFDIGSRRITDMFLKSDPPKRDELDTARAWIREQAAGFFAALPKQPQEILAVAGTATSAITVRDRVVEYDSTCVHGKRLTVGELEELIWRLAALTEEERMRVPGLHPKRAPVIIGGLTALVEMLLGAGKDSLLVSDTDILQGIVLVETTI